MCISYLQFNHYSISLSLIILPKHIVLFMLDEPFLKMLKADTFNALQLSIEMLAFD